MFAVIAGFKLAFPQLLPNPSIGSQHIIETATMVEPVNPRLCSEGDRTRNQKVKPMRQKRT